MNRSQEIDNLQIEQQMERLRLIADPAARATATDLVASVLQLHGCALEKMLDILQQTDSNAPGVFEAFESDEVVRGVLLLHDLHSESPRTRAKAALADLRPRLEKHGASAELIEADETVIRVLVRGKAGGCGSTAETVRAMVETSLTAAAPDATEIVVEAVSADPGFVQIDSIEPSRESLPSVAQIQT